MTELKASLVLQLKNMLRGGIGQVRGELKGLKSEAQGLGAIRGPNAEGMIRYGRSAREASQAVRELKRQQAGLGAGASGNTILAGTGRTALMLGGLYGGAQATRAVVGGTVGQAVSFEKAFAQVRKKVDAPDEAGFRELEQRINRIAKDYGLARAQVAELTAEAGAAGIAYQDLERFMRLTAKAAVAWDMSPQEASQKLAEIKAGTQMTIAEIEVLANKINGLGDNSAAKERDIVEMFGRSGAAAKAAGVNFDVTLAALTAVRSTGLQPEIAARWFSAFTGGLRTIEDGTKKSKEGLKLLGLDAKTVAEGMKRDALATMLDIFDRLEKAPDKATAAIKIFGKEWWDETSRAGQALPELRKQLEYLKSGKWGGSLDKTLGIELATTANHLERFKALVSEIGDRMGRWALPPLNATIDGLIKKYDELKERLENKPGREAEDKRWKTPEMKEAFKNTEQEQKERWDFFERNLIEPIFGKKLTKDPYRNEAARFGGEAADAEALAQKQTGEAAVLRAQAANAKAKPDRARLTLEAQKKEKEAADRLSTARNLRHLQGRALARDMTNVEGGEQQLKVRARSDKQKEIDALLARIAAVEAEKSQITRRNPISRKAGAGKVGELDAELQSLRGKLKELEGEAAQTGSAVKDKLTLDLTSQGAATAMSWANGLRAGVPAVEAAAQALRAPIMTPAAPMPGGSRPLSGGSASAPARPTQVQVAGIHIHGVSDPDRAAKRAVTELAQRIRSAQEGAHHDGVT